MTQNTFYTVVTTIQPPTAAMKKLGREVERSGGKLLVVGDKKGPSTYPLSGTELLTLEQQAGLPLQLSRLLPVNHYVRKNLGYLVAISRQPSCIYETDDDNAPTDRWKVRTPSVAAIPLSHAGWCNVYAYFSREYIWPRGFPLEETAASRSWKLPLHALTQIVDSPLQQGLADGSPDVDAIWRLLLPEDVRFIPKRTLALLRGAWCPSNSQNTWWWPSAYALMYLPSYCTFRMTDIWRSFVAQRCVWELGGAVTFHAPDVVQDRNVHNLLKDFRDEVPGYLQNAKIADVLSSLTLQPGPSAVPTNLWHCYEALVAHDIFPRKELRLVKAWLNDLKSIEKGLAL